MFCAVSAPKFVWDGAEGWKGSRVCPFVVGLCRPAFSAWSVAWSVDSKGVTWLILPVVICLSQRLSHACLSMNVCIL